MHGVPPCLLLSRDVDPGSPKPLHLCILVDPGGRERPTILQVPVVLGKTHLEIPHLGGQGKTLTDIAT